MSVYMRKAMTAGIIAAMILSAASCGNNAQTFQTSVSESHAASITDTEAVTDETDVTTAPAEESTAEESTAEESTAEESKAPETKKETVVPENKEKIVLENKMTECERALAKKQDFSLIGDIDMEKAEVGIGNVIVTKDLIVAMYDKWLENGIIDEAEHAESIKNAEGYSYRAALVNGIEYNGFIPEEGYDGGAFTDWEGNNYENMQAYFDWLNDVYYKEQGFNVSETVDRVRQVKFVFEAIVSNTFTALPDRIASHVSDISYRYSDPKADYRSKWTLHTENIEFIRDKTDEYNVYDEELNTLFKVYVTLPPDYDSSRSYPVLFMTDAVWRVNDHAQLYKTMENGEADDVILVSLGYNYTIDGTDDFVRFVQLISERRKLLDFITDNLMPYLGENYNIDYADSTLFGHSMAGVFSHCALFESDKYENKPFGKYIIGSPAFWNLYDDNWNLEPETIDTDYGYFDRNDKLDKQVFLCGGSLEDPDYESQFNGHDSTLTGLEKLNDRLNEHGADVTYKLYESHHYQYVTDMLIEYLKTTYPEI